MLGPWGRGVVASNRFALGAGNDAGSIGSGPESRRARSRWEYESHNAADVHLLATLRRGRDRGSLKSFDGLQGDRGRSPCPGDRRGRPCAGRVTPRTPGIPEARACPAGTGGQSHPRVRHARSPRVTSPASQSGRCGKEPAPRPRRGEGVSGCSGATWCIMAPRA